MFNTRRGSTLREETRRLETQNLRQRNSGSDRVHRVAGSHRFKPEKEAEFRRRKRISHGNLRGKRINVEKKHLICLNLPV